MSIELWVGVGELVGAIAVVATLIYLAVQIRDSNREARSGTLQSALSNEMDMLTVFIDNASVWDKIVSGASLEEGEETRKGVLLYGLLMTETESRFHQYFFARALFPRPPIVDCFPITIEDQQYVYAAVANFFQLIQNMIGDHGLEPVADLWSRLASITGAHKAIPDRSQARPCLFHHSKV